MISIIKSHSDFIRQEKSGPLGQDLFNLPEKGDSERSR